jgi:hypothetical protein
VAKLCKEVLKLPFGDFKDKLNEALKQHVDSVVGVSAGPPESHGMSQAVSRSSRANAHALRWRATAGTRG